MRRLLLTLAALAALPGTALAQDPVLDTGTPKVTWDGNLQGTYASHNLYNYEPTAGTTGTLPCQAPSCDTFTLTNALGGVDMLIELASEQSPDISVRIQDPSGTWTYYDGWSDGSPATKLRLKKAAKGDYVLNVVARVFGTTNPTAVDDHADYKGVASLVLPAPALPAPLPVVAVPAPAAAPAPAAPAKQPSAKAACQKKAKKIKNKRKRKAALKRCAKKR